MIFHPSVGVRATLKVIVPAILVSTAAVVLMERGDGFSEKHRHAIERREHFEEVTASEIGRLDEVLTMSARLGAATADKKWERRYHEHAPKLDLAIRSVFEVITDRELIERLDAVNQELVGMETRAFDLTRAGRGAQALSLLNGAQYAAAKDDYARFLAQIRSAAHQDWKNRSATEQRWLFAAENSRPLGLIVILASWIVVLWKLLRYFRGRDASEMHLIEANDQLESTVAERTRQLRVSNESLKETITQREEIALYMRVQLEAALLLAHGTIFESVSLKIVEVVCRDLCWSAGAIWMLDEEKGLLRCVGFHQNRSDRGDVEFESAARLATLPKGVGLPGKVWADGQPIWIENIRADRNSMSASYTAKAGLGSAFALPIMSMGRTLGVMEFFRKEPSPIAPDLVAHVRVLGVHLGQFMDREQSRALHEEARAQLVQSQKMEAVGRLAGGVAHDFNNVLSAILGYCDLLIPGFPPDDQRLEDLTELRAAANRAAALTRQLLAFSRHQTMAPAVVEVNEVVSDLMSMLERILPDKVRIKLELAEDAGRAILDSGQLEQALVNLAINAGDAMPLGGEIVIGTKNLMLDEKACASLGTLRPGAHVLISVQDDGAGISAELQKRIFEPFFTTKPAGKGTGLGLSMAYGIASQNGGHLGLVSEPGRGSTFSIYLPRTDRPASKGEREQGGHSSGKELVLLVEDEAPVRRVLERVLTRLGYGVVSAASGEEAIRLLERERPAIDLLLTDMSLPGMSGTDLAGHVLVKLPAVKIVCMSGYTESQIQKLTEHRFLEKPFTSANLANTIRNVLDSSGPSPSSPT
ncbi:MAG: ATP-binding protein [Elusimicrobiota bacterium]